MTLTPIELLKRQAAEQAADLVRSGMRLGLGTGSTAAHFVNCIGERAREGLDVTCVPTSERTRLQAEGWGLRLSTLDETPELDLTVDGADEFDAKLRLIKGGGGALLREKIVAQASRREVIVVDESKLSPRLGTHRVVPVEVMAFGWRSQLRFLEGLGAAVTLRSDANGTFHTDGGNLILDAGFGPVANAQALADQLGQRAGIVEHGLFIGLATDLVVAGRAGVRHLRRGEDAVPA